MLVPITIRCHSCGFILYQGNELKSIDVALREWSYRCPACLSPLSKTPIRWKME
jgi:Zn finger protein HypA/HybF involved in hydrogenase expression